MYKLGDVRDEDIRNQFLFIDHTGGSSTFVWVTTLCTSTGTLGRHRRGMEGVVNDLLQLKFHMDYVGNTKTCHRRWKRCWEALSVL